MSSVKYIELDCISLLLFFTRKKERLYNTTWTVIIEIFLQRLAWTLVGWRAEYYTLFTLNDNNLLRLLRLLRLLTLTLTLTNIAKRIRIENIGAGWGEGVLKGAISVVDKCLISLYKKVQGGVGESVKGRNKRSRENIGFSFV